MRELLFLLFSILVGSFIVPYILAIFKARNRLTALIVELRYNQVTLNRYKKSGNSLEILSSTAYDEFKQDYLLAKILVKDTENRTFDHIHNAYAFHQSRSSKNSDHEWSEVIKRFNKADQRLSQFLQSKNPRFAKLIPVFDRTFFQDVVEVMRPPGDQDNSTES